jgi:hypothetical protein
MYGSDLLGATVGALVVVPLMTVVPTPLILAGTGLLPLAALALLETSAARVAVALSLAIVNSMIWGTPYLLHYSKSYLEKSELLFERWTPTARLTILDQRDPTAFGWGMGSRYVPSPLEQIWVQQDGSAGTPVTRLRDAPDDLGHLFFDVTSVGYQLEPPKEVCIIGAGGGRDVLTALHARADRVDAVELNPAIVAALSGPFKDFTGDVYHRAGVNAVISEGRSFLTRSPERYDLIQVSLIDTWAATSAGAFALSENYLYTEEALRLYWERLSDSGLVSISRWMSGMRQLESLRLAILAKTALEHEGVSDASAHLAMVQAGKVGTLLVSKRPFDAERLARLDAIDRERGFVRHWPVAPETPADSSLAKVMSGGWEFLRADGLDLQAPTDDKPFFFQTASILARPGALGSATGNEQSVVLLRCLLVLMAALTVVTYFAPFALSGRLARHPGFWRGSVYFVLIGLAFMCVEAPLIQRFILYLGHPSYATTVVLATLLLGAGLGSTLAARAPVGRVASFVLPLGVVLVDVGLEAVFTGTLGWDLAARVGVSVLALAPLGFLMGFAFPLGMIRFGDGNRAWFWAMNGTVSVLASVSSLALAMVFGFSGVILVGAALYASACVVLPDIGPGSKVPPASSV